MVYTDGVDAAKVRRMTKELFEQYGVSVTVASNGLEAVAQVKMLEKMYCYNDSLREYV
jgi:CheY-like chemotaxis protein